MTEIFQAKSLFEELKKEIKDAINCLDRKPCLQVLLVGDNPASKVYLKHKEKACKEVGINFELTTLKSFNKTTIENYISVWNESPDVDGIFIQLPIPECSQTAQFNILNKINPCKDVDGFSAYNIACIDYNQPGLFPCAPLAVQYIIQKKNIDVRGKHVVIINDTIVVGRPLSGLLLNMGATVTVCNDKTQNLKDIVMSADIIVTAVGRRDKFELNYCKKDAYIFDVAISKVDDKIVGDVNVESLLGIAKMITAVPGGIGPLTIGMLLRNTVWSSFNFHPNHLFLARLA